MWLRRCRRSVIVLFALMVVVTACGGDTAITNTTQTAASTSATTAPTTSTSATSVSASTAAPDAASTTSTTVAGSASETTQAPAAEEAAASFRGYGRAGRFPGPAPEGAPGLAWTFSGEGGAVLPVLEGGVAYTQDTAAVTALDLGSGEVIWSTALPTADPETPVLSGGAVIALSVPEPYEDAAGWHPSGVTEIVAFDSGDGTRLWRAPVDALVEVAAPAIDEDVLVMVGTGDLLWEACGDLCYPDGWVVAFDALTGQELWRVAENAPRTVGAAEGTVVVPFGNSPLVAYDLATGDELWLTWRCTGGMGPPAITNGRVVLATDSTAVPYEPCRQAFDLRTGDALWSREIERQGQRLLVLTDDTAFIGDGQAISAIDAATGEELWREDGLVGQPTMVGQQIIVDGVDAEDNRIMVGLRVADGLEVWRLDVTGEYSSWGGWGVVAADGVVIRTDGNTLQAFAVEG